MIFRDRRQAGRLLARQLEKHRAAHPIVVGVPAGGVFVADEVARALDATLDVLVVRRIAAPDDPERTLGAIAEDGSCYLSTEAILQAGLGERQVESIVDSEISALASSTRAHHMGRSPPDVGGRTVIVVDDAIATGSTIRAACRALRGRRAAYVVVAAPVVAAPAWAAVRPECDEIVTLEKPPAVDCSHSSYERVVTPSPHPVLAYVHGGQGREREEADGGDIWDTWERDWGAPAPEQADEAKRDRRVEISFGPAARGPGVLVGRLNRPSNGAQALVVFAEARPFTADVGRDPVVVTAMQRAGYATLACGLLASAETGEAASRGLRDDVEVLTARIVTVLRWIAVQPELRGLHVGVLVSGASAAATLAAAALRPELIRAVVARGGRPDLVDRPVLDDVLAPVLLMVGSLDTDRVLASNRRALQDLAYGEVLMFPGATQACAEPGVEAMIARLAVTFFRRHLRSPARRAAGA